MSTKEMSAIKLELLDIYHEINSVDEETANKELLIEKSLCCSGNYRVL